MKNKEPFNEDLDEIELGLRNLQPKEFRFLCSFEVKT